MFTAVLRSNPSQVVTRSCASIAAAICLAFFAAGVSRASGATGASEWAGDARSAARLIAGAVQTDQGAKIHRAGVEIRMAPGWKTYWRYPGDSGVPPHFDFAGSDNVKNVTVLWPAPQRLVDSEGVTIGYKSNVIFPVRIEAQDPAKPVTLRLKLDYAICEKLCIPVDARSELSLTGAASATDALLSAAEKRVPQPAEVGKGKDISIVSVRREAAASPARILVDVKAPAGTTAELFAEGPTPNWALPVPEPVAGADAGSQRFAFVLDGLPPGASAKGAVLTLTASAGERAIETRFRLD
ncbi:MAG: protein-disulfide reductase DsbD family protein [Pseudorhodoplanes sp.]|jgi:DsbC/DsbD-like thiol-disulfide interchange protein|nr:protein-disulfide reductase DsbD family protein [Pseudorhodoplanes sp.]